MKIFQPLCVAVLVLSAYAGNVAASAPAVSDDSLAFNNMTDNPTWETPDLPYARLLSSSSASAATHWSTSGARQVALAPPRPMTAAPAQQANVPAPVPEASMYSMLLVGLGLVALSLHGEKQEKFDN